jgi:asparagine synthase (glutamine-hydrolysing)
MSTSYFGGMTRRAPAGWRCVSGDAQMFATEGGGARLFTWGDLGLIIRGYARRAGDTGPLDLEAIAADLRARYLEQNTLAVDDLDGCFTIALVDGAARRIVLFRSLVGAGFTYYHSHGDDFLFGGNLAQLVDAAGQSPRENLLALPTFFLFRFVPGRETLFDDFFRVLPGEEVVWSGRSVRRRQRHRFSDLIRKQSAGDPLEALEETTARVLSDCAAHRPGTANLLSGGVDSSYLQAIWSRINGRQAQRSYSLTVDHPRSHADTEYARSMADALQTAHTFVPADRHYAEYLVDTIAATGEPPNHVQSAYFGALARAMRADGAATGLCGEGADSLFGVGLANQIQNARIVRALLPLSVLRRTVASVTALLGWHRVASTCRLANGIADYSDLNHPVNRVASFADWDSVEACFGRAGVVEAAAYRRELLHRLGISADPLDRLHGAGYLGEAADSASLWTTLFNAEGADMLCPFLDSRMLRLALNLPRSVRYPFRRPKELLKRALARHVGDSMARRPKLGFGQPIFEWMSPGGQLRHLVERVEQHEFIDATAFQQALREPSWFLYSLLCYDVWYKLFIDRSLPRRGKSETASGHALPQGRHQ